MHTLVFLLLAIDCGPNCKLLFADRERQPPPRPIGSDRLGARQTSSGRRAKTWRSSEGRESVENGLQDRRVVGPRGGSGVVDSVCWRRSALVERLGVPSGVVRAGRNSPRPFAKLADRQEYLRRVAGVSVSESTLSRAIRRMGFGRKKGRWVPVSKTSS
jgi:hypothetical protein